MKVHTKFSQKKNKISKGFKDMVHFFSDNSIQNIYGESKENLNKIRDYLNFAADELDNYFDNVTVNSNRITLY